MTTKFRLENITLPLLTLTPRNKKNSFFVDFEIFFKCSPLLEKKIYIFLFFVINAKVGKILGITPETSK